MPDGSQEIDRTGGREWFGAHLRLGEHQRHEPAAYGVSATMHLSAAVVIVLLVMTRTGFPSVAKAESSLLMPVMLLVVASPGVPDLPRPAKPSRPKPAPPPPPPAATSTPSAVQALAPVEAPPSIEPERGTEGGAESGGKAGGVVGGVTGGTVGGVLGNVATGEVAGSTGPVRLGPGVQPPRKVKDVKAVYPQGALPGQVRGTVIIEATIGTNGKVSDAKVVRSISALDQAALDAVLQWEYEPARLNGMPVAVVMTVSVSFSIL